MATDHEPHTSSPVEIVAHLPIRGERRAREALMITDSALREQALIAIPPRILSDPDHAGFRLALACARADRPATDGAIRNAAAEIADWTGALQVIRRHRIAGLAHHALARLKCDMPAAPRRALAMHAMAQARCSLALASEAFRLADAFAEARIPLAFLKGPVLSHQLHGDLGRRHSRDLDLIVAPADRNTAAALLEGLGYRPVKGLDLAAADGWTRSLNEWEYRHPQSQIVVELHWRFCPNRRLAEPLSRFATWDDIALGGGRTLRTLTGESLAAYLCLHGSLHAWSRLKWLADLDTLLAAQGPEAPERLLVFAGRTRLTRPIALGLTLAQTLLDTPLHEDVRRQLAADATVRSLGRTALAAMRTGKGGVELEETRFGSTRVRLSHFRLGRGWRHWWAQAIAAMSSAEDRAAVRLPPALSCLYPLLRPVLWALRRAPRIPSRSAPHDDGSGRR